MTGDVYAVPMAYDGDGGAEMTVFDDGGWIFFDDGGDAGEEALGGIFVRSAAVGGRL